MCHVITHKKGIFHQSGNDLIGQKSFTILRPDSGKNAGNIIHCFTGMRHDVVKVDPFFPFVKVDVQIQDIDFRIKTTYQTKPFVMCGSIQTGAHISPFYNTFINFIPYLDLNWGYKIAVPVIFNPADIIFYDGEDISVSKYAFLDPKESTAIFEYPGNHKDYAQLYNDLKKFFNEGTK